MRKDAAHEVQWDWQHADTAAFHTPVTMSALQADAGPDIAARWVALLVLLLNNKWTLKSILHGGMPVHNPS